MTGAANQFAIPDVSIGPGIVAPLLDIATAGLYPQVPLIYPDPTQAYIWDQHDVFPDPTIYEDLNVSVSPVGEIVDFAGLVLPPEPSVPVMVAPPPAISTPALPGETVGGIPSPVPPPIPIDEPTYIIAEVPVVVDPGLPQQVIPSPPVTTGGLGTPTTTDGGIPLMSEDLGATVGGVFDTVFGTDIFDVLGGAYDIYQGMQAPDVAAAPIPTTTGGTVVSQVPAQGVPQYPAVMDTRKQYCLKNVNGQWKWVKRYKRRRKRLATPTDIKDLAALKGVVGQGKILETWIATHG